MANIVVFGAGFVAGPAIDFLLEQDHSVVIANFDMLEAEKQAAGRNNVSVIQADVTNIEQVQEIISGQDVVISLVPYTFHQGIAQACIAEKVHLVTASYQSEALLSLNDAAKSAGVMILNEIGLDPGIDHLTAMEVIDSVHAAGGKIDQFVSWCGGLPAPQHNNNPVGYKFSWSPRAVLLALLNNAQYLKHGDLVTIPSEKLLTDVSHIEVSDELELEGYPNRDSVSYQQTYQIPEAKTVFRGTLRYPGFCELFQWIKDAGYITEAPVASDLSTWKALSESLNVDFSSATGPIAETVEWLGLNSELPIKNHASCLDALSQLLLDKLQFEEGEQDMIVMQHQFDITTSDSARVRHTSTMVVEGDVNGHSAMAKTVGIPVSAAAHLIATKQVTGIGCYLPVNKDLYLPLLAILKSKGIEMTEKQQPL
jgi:saccharopine dehydrogenase (NADP+, L-glutamate forming)